MEAYVINMKKDVERWESWLNRWSHIITGKRYDAIKHAHPHIGCTLSHIGIIRQQFSNSDKNIVFVMEDDAIPFNITQCYMKELLDELESTWESWEIACLSTTNFNPNEIPICEDIGSNNFMKLYKTDTTSLVASHVSVYSRGIIKYIDSLESILLQNISIPSDRFQFKTTWGPYRIPEFTTLLLKRTIAKQYDIKMSYDTWETEGANAIKIAWENRIINKIIHDKNNYINSNTEIKSDVTVITGLFLSNTTLSLNNYLEQCKIFLKSISCSVVLFTTSHFKEFLQSLKISNLIIVDISSIKLEYNIDLNNWIDQVIRIENMLGKKINIDYLELKLKKTSFVNYVINNMSINSMYYVWADIDLIRDNDMIQHIKSWPSLTKLRLALNTHDICFQQNYPIIEKSSIKYNDSLILNPIISGGIIAGTKKGWKYIIDLLPNEIIHLKSYNALWIYDEYIYLSLLNRYPNIFTSYQIDNKLYNGYYILSEAFLNFDKLGAHFIYFGEDLTLYNKLRYYCINNFISISKYSSYSEDIIQQLFDNGANRVIYNITSDIDINDISLEMFLSLKYYQIQNKYFYARSKYITPYLFITT